MRKLVRALVTLRLVGSTALVALVGLFVWHFEYGIGLPDRQKLLAVSAADRFCSSGGERDFVALAAAPPIVRAAFLAAEEPDFYDRPLINSLFIEYVRAALSKRAPSGSPISLSVARCLMASSPECCPKHINWSIGAFVLMARIEGTLSRDVIFELFLNDIYFGRGAYGAGTAAKAYFGKSLSDLTVEEAAYIAALVKAPNHYGRNNERGTARRNLVIDRMRDARVISPAQAVSAQQQPLLLRDVSAPI